MKWVTRERPKIDRIACPWLVVRFIDREPEFLFVPPSRVTVVAEETGAIPYDVPGVELSHVGDIEVTALHNHMLSDQPRLFFMHFWANDEVEKLARGLREALDKVNLARS